MTSIPNWKDFLAENARPKNYETSKDGIAEFCGALDNGRKVVLVTSGGRVDR
jgi:hypothetical protein